MQKLNSPRKQFLGKAASKGDLAPSVDHQHLKLVWQLYRDGHLRHPGEPVAVSLASLHDLLPDTGDIYAVHYRAGLLNTLHYILSNYPEKLGDENLICRLNRFKHADDFADCLIRVMARIPVEWMQMGFAYSGWPYDIDEFIRQVEQEAA
jgi:hypothetical protein